MKKDTNDTRESAAIEIIRIIAKKGAVVSYHDPYIPSVETGHALSLHALSLHSIPLFAIFGKTTLSDQ